MKQIFIFSAILMAACSTGNKNVKADSLQIVSAFGTQIYGEMTFDMSMNAQAGGDVKVIIFRQILPQYKKTADEWGVKEGAAYIQNSSTDYKYIKNVDLNLTDKELALMFGIEVDN